MEHVWLPVLTMVTFAPAQLDSMEETVKVGQSVDLCRPVALYGKLTGWQHSQMYLCPQDNLVKATLWYNRHDVSD